MFVPVQKELDMVTDCPFCLETGNTTIVKALGRDNQVEIEVVADKNPRLLVHYFDDGWLATWSIGMRIKYCPMCGRRLTDGQD